MLQQSRRARGYLAELTTQEKPDVGWEIASRGDKYVLLGITYPSAEAWQHVREQDGNLILSGAARGR